MKNILIVLLVLAVVWVAYLNRQVAAINAEQAALTSDLQKKLDAANAQLAEIAKRQQQQQQQQQQRQQQQQGMANWLQKKIDERGNALSTPPNGAPNTSPVGSSLDQPPKRSGH